MSDVTEHESGHPYTRRVSIGPHPDRKDSPDYKKSRKRLKDLSAQAGPLLYGKPPFEDHHGGGLWLKDKNGWFLIKNVVGMEWSSQFCADPAKVDQLRRTAQRIYAAFPEAVKELGIADLLDTEITDATGVARWVDSICNASVPLPSDAHRGALPEMAGTHHYPEPIVDIQFFKQDDFPLWVSDDAGGKVALVPVGERGSGDGRVLVLAQESDDSHRGLAAEAIIAGEVLDADHPLAKRAFALQERAIAAGTVAASDPMSRLRQG
jgi:hypothetical protein